MATVIKTSIPNDLRAAVEVRIDECLAIAERKWGYTSTGNVRPAVYYDVRGTCAGKANGIQNWVSFNAILLVENKEQFIERTVTHEVAHIIAYRQFNAKGHDSTWKAVMSHLGADASRCHTYDTSNAQVKVKNKFIYECECRSDIVLTSVRHNKILRGATFRCNQCRSVIKLVKKAGQVSMRTAKEMA